MTRSKPLINLQRYDRSQYNVLVCTKAGEVSVTWSGTYKAAAFRASSQASPSKNPRTYRCTVVRPGADLLTQVNWTIDGWQPEGTTS